MCKFSKNAKKSAKPLHPNLGPIPCHGTHVELVHSIVVRLTNQLAAVPPVVEAIAGQADLHALISEGGGGQADRTAGIRWNGRHKLHQADVIAAIRPVCGSALVGVRMPDESFHIGLENVLLLQRFVVEVQDPDPRFATWGNGHNFQALAFEQTTLVLAGWSESRRLSIQVSWQDSNFMGSFTFYPYSQFICNILSLFLTIFK